MQREKGEGKKEVREREEEGSSLNRMEFIPRQVKKEEMPQSSIFLLQNIFCFMQF